MDEQKFYITTPIYYPSGDAHVGHCYTTVACDAVARFKRAQGFDVLFSTGTDEHGQKIENKAKEKGVTPKEYVDEIVAKFKKLWQFLGISYDRFIRTTDDYHVSSVQKIFEELYQKGFIYKGQYEGKYCTPCESFWTESQLVDGKCPDCGREVITATEEAYFFKLSMFSERIKELLKTPGFLEPQSRVNEMLNFVGDGLKDLCVSRSSFTWGIPVTFDSKHVVYVWLDALTNYITLLGYDNLKYNDFEKYWPADVHVMAKEIVRFHAVIWPAILMALDLPLPKHIVGHGWLTFDGKKMSKSLGNVVDPFILGERYGVDSLRYGLLKIMAFGSDCSFSNEILIDVINKDLVNTWGNLVSRTCAMAVKYFDGNIPKERKFVDEIDEKLVREAEFLKDKVEIDFDKIHISDGLEKIMDVLSIANKYIDETEPWNLAKEEDKSRLACVLYNLLETIRICGTLLTPVIPNSMNKVWAKLNLDEKQVTWNKASLFGAFEYSGVNKGENLFPRIDAEAEIEELNKLLKK